MKGYSLPGLDGGSISLHSGSVSVVSEKDTSIEPVVGVNDDIPEAIKNRLVLDDDYFKDTGFTSITLMASNGVEIKT